MTEFHHEPDACGLNCPLPVLRAKKTLDKMASGEVLQIITSDPGSVEDMAALARQTGQPTPFSRNIPPGIFPRRYGPPTGPRYHRLLWGRTLSAAVDLALSHENYLKLLVPPPGKNRSRD